jgi:hypothetical protein
MKRSEKRHRQKKLTIRFNETEWQDVQTRADVAGLTTAGFSRAAILNAKPLRASRRPPVDRAELAFLLADIGKIGSNINQLAKLANLGGWPEHEDLRQAVADIRWMRDVLLKALGYTPPASPGVSRDPQSLTA